MENRDNRLTEILGILKARNASSVKELSERLLVSQQTVRRDLQLLAGRGSVHLMHGGAALVPSADGDTRYSLALAGTQNREEKTRIGAAAAALLEPNDVIIIDAGSTTEFLARAIPADLPITVICYTLNIVVEVTQKGGCTPIFCGGYYHENALMFESTEGIDLIRKHRATKAFISAAGISDRLGATCSNAYERATKRAAIESSLETILVADSSKFGRVRPVHFADLTEIDALVSDYGLDPEQADTMRGVGMRVELV